jgi:hypothetical protein
MENGEWRTEKGKGRRAEKGKRKRESGERRTEKGKGGREVTIY